MYDKINKYILPNIVFNLTTRFKFKRINYHIIIVWSHKSKFCPMWIIVKNNYFLFHIEEFDLLLYLKICYQSLKIPIEFLLES